MYLTLLMEHTWIHVSKRVNTWKIHDMNVARKNIKTIDVENPLYEKITKKSKEKNLSIHKFTNELLRQSLTKDEFVKRVEPGLKLLEFEEESMLIRDDLAKKTRLATITIRNGKLWCDLDEKNDCNHIHYVLMLPDIVNFKDKLKQI